MRTTASSILSALSLTDVSNISVLAIPIYAHEISNSRRYKFGEFESHVPAQEQHPSVSSINEALKANKWDRFASAVSRRRRDKEPEAVQEPGVLGVPLRESLKYASLSVKFINKDGLSFNHDHIPIFVAKPMLFLQEHGKSLHDQTHADDDYILHKPRYLS